MPRHIESATQKAFKRWFDMQYPALALMCFAVGNGGKRNRIEAAIMKGEGVVAGVADMIVALPRGGYGCLGLEFKTETGTLSENQRIWGEVFEDVGNLYCVVRSVDEAIDIVKLYIDGDIQRFKPMGAKSRVVEVGFDDPNAERRWLEHVPASFKTLAELYAAFPDEQSCIDHLEMLRWQGHVVSPFDPESKVYKCKDNKYRCKNTGKYFNVRTNTLFDSTKIELRKWFAAIWLFCTSERMPRSTELAPLLGITQKSAWEMLRKLKECYVTHASNYYTGKV